MNDQNNLSFQIRKMTNEAAKDIVHWQYPTPYELYSMDGSNETLSYLLSDGYYLISTPIHSQFGYFCLGDEARVPGGYTAKIYDDRENVIDLGLGMHPDLTGSGLGHSFISAILDWIKNHFPIAEVRLVVATFNERAIRAYEKVGFILGNTFFTKVGNWDIPFVVMRKFPLNL